MISFDTYPTGYVPYVPQVLHTPDLQHAWSFAAFDAETQGDAIVAICDDGRELTAQQVRDVLEKSGNSR